MFLLLSTVYCLFVCKTLDLSFIYSVIFWIFYISCYFYYKKNVFFIFENKYLQISDPEWYNVATPYYLYLKQNNIEITQNLIYNSFTCWSIIIFFIVVIRILI